MRENKVQEDSEYEHFSRSVFLLNMNKSGENYKVIHMY